MYKRYRNSILLLGNKSLKSDFWIKNAKNTKIYMKSVYFFEQIEYNIMRIKSGGIGIC